MESNKIDAINSLLSVASALAGLESMDSIRISTPAKQPDDPIPQEKTSQVGLSDFIGKYCIVRTYSAGVWAGYVTKKSGNEVIVSSARRLYRWKAASSISLSAVAMAGINRSESKICAPVDEVWLEAIELIPATSEAMDSIVGADCVEAK